MSDKEYKWIGWDKPKTIISKYSQEMRLPVEYLKLYKQGTFHFNDGTTKGWTIDQIYDTEDENMVKINPFMGFCLCNYQNRALAAGAYPLLVLGSSAKSLDFYLDSPDLVTINGWGNFKGYSLDLQRNFCSPCGDPKSKYFIQLQVKLWDKQKNKMKTFAEWDDKAKEFVFHEVIAFKPYHLVWTPKESWVGDPDLQLRFLRIRFTQPNFTAPGSGECLPKGEWLIGNISPE